MLASVREIPQSLHRIFLLSSPNFFHRSTNCGRAAGAPEQACSNSFRPKDFFPLGKFGMQFRVSFVLFVSSLSNRFQGNFPEWASPVSLAERQIGGFNNRITHRKSVRFRTITFRMIITEVFGAFFLQLTSVNRSMSHQGQVQVSVSALSARCPVFFCSDEQSYEQPTSTTFPRDIGWPICG